MHGRPRKPAKEEDPLAEAAKTDKLRSLQTQLLHNHHNRIYTKDALEISSKLLEVNPEVYTAWNYRKLAVESMIGDLKDDEEQIKSVVIGELRIVEIALRRNPKCYGAWHHRKWVLQRELLPTNFDHEFRLLDQLLKADSRNFHGWNYRRFVAALKNVSEEDELKFMTDKINANFSNYSAWHNRSVLLSQLLKNKAQDSLAKEKVLEEELVLVHQALFTDPDDQSGWFYYLWLLDQTTSHNPLLISSWPANGSNIVLSNNGSTNDQISETISENVRLNETIVHHIPIVLCFNQPVKGINSSTISVQSSFTVNKDLTWKPLANGNSDEACYWMTHLKLPERKSDACISYPVEVTLDHCHGGIMSSNSSELSGSYKFKFVVDIKYTLETLDGNLAKEMFVWEDDNSYKKITLAPEFDCTTSLKQLQITMNLEQAEASKWCMETLSNEVSLFRELLSEMDCKIAKLTVARLLVALDAMSSNEQKKVHTEEALKLYDDLMELDHPHVGYYKDERSLVLIDQITYDKELLARHCWQNPMFQNQVFLRLNNLSLSRIGFMERLLWVHMLDLSHNELKSIEGLEAMQLLCCLSLRGNKISTFTALGPLKLLPSLKVLDLSYNEIGSHPVDTTRYLCDSPLLHSTTMNKNSDMDRKRNSKEVAANQWEAILLFQGLQLTQLDIVGNAIANQEFRTTLVKILPTLTWFDGAGVEQP